MQDADFMTVSNISYPQRRTTRRTNIRTKSSPSPTKTMTLPLYIVNTALTLFPMKRNLGLMNQLAIPADLGLVSGTSGGMGTMVSPTKVTD